MTDGQELSAELGLQSVKTYARFCAVAALVFNVAVLVCEKLVYAGVPSDVADP